MTLDDEGNKVGEGDRIFFLYGIPPLRCDAVIVRDAKGTLVVQDELGQTMPLEDLKDWYNFYKVESDERQQHSAAEPGDDE